MENNNNLHLDIFTGIIYPNYKPIGFVSTLDIDTNYLEECIKESNGVLEEYKEEINKQIKQDFNNFVIYGE